MNFLSTINRATDSGAAMKITGAAAAKKYSFEQCVSLGRAVNAQVVSIGSALDHCHVPGRQANKPIPRDVAIVGAGIHNEPVSQGMKPAMPVQKSRSQSC